MGQETDTFRNSSELSPLKKGEKKGKLPFWASLSLRALGVLSLSFAIGANAQAVYDASRYEKFFVNGLSMYPTLNRNARAFDPSGQEKSVNGDFDERGWTYICDYGLFDDDASAMNGLSRFDVVVTYFQSDYADGALKSGASLKIKRVIGLPGETVFFSDGTDGYEAGDLILVSQEGSEELIEQDFLDDSESHKEETLKGIAGGGSFLGSRGNPAILGEDEYYLVGDNRSVGASDDSRKEGAVKKSQIMGKAVAIIAECSYKVSTGEVNIDWGTLKMPWGYQFL